ncbi:hypothetical protein N5T16_27370 [Escherichia coli]|uniref:hypothetical protein n=1 Tax=Escherichia coli TaxID=562 RepID=UPI00222752DD|nr:hypothetical protein [Escherichia coli]MCW3282433.1 hypothetical protein [Escherichia coli]
MLFSVVTVLVIVVVLLPLLLSVTLLFMAFLGVPLTGRAVVNGASEAVSALAGSIPDAKLLACSDRSGRAASVAPWPVLLASRQKAAGM